MVNEIPKSLSILREACATENVSFEVVDSFTGFVARLTKGLQSYLVGAAGIGVYPINRAGPFAIARDKAFTHYVLRQSGFRIPEGEHFFLRAPFDFPLPAGRERSDAAHYARRLSDDYALPLIVKPNSGKGARLVTYVRDEDAFNVALDVISGSDYIALVQSFIDAAEYRFFLVDGEIAFAYRKSRPTVTGDGRASVRELCERRDPANVSFHSGYLGAQLAARALTIDSVLPHGAELAVDVVANLSAGGCFDGFIEPSAEVRDWARRLAEAVSLRVTGIDLFSVSELKDANDIIVTDVNGSPNLGTLHDLGNHDLVFRVWRTILRKTFDEPWPERF